MMSQCAVKKLLTHTVKSKDCTVHNTQFWTLPCLYRMQHVHAFLAKIQHSSINALKFECLCISLAAMYVTVLCAFCCI